MSFLTVFQEYHDNGRVIMKGCVQSNPVYGRKDFRLQRLLNPGPLDQQASVEPTEVYHRSISYVRLSYGNNVKPDTTPLFSDIPFESQPTQPTVSFRNPDLP